MGLLGPDGLPISSDKFANKKAPPPKLGEAFGAWAGRDIQYASLPGGGVIQFDLSKLTLSDFRSMRDHYQVNASLAVLSFMQHQSDWHIESTDPRIAEFCEEQLRNVWTQLNRGMATANWAGYSPNALDWKNDVNGRAIVIDKVKDLVPEECSVNWKEVEGWAPPGRVQPKFKVYDGIKHQATPGWPIPVESSFWYPLLMENGDYYGRKLLRPAFTSWFFSLLVHLFANRYYERFGEPTPVGRAPFDDEIDVDGESVRGNVYMLQVLQQLRNRSVVVLPNDSTEGQNGKRNFDYDLEYLESQMRGADFERYLTRLDEEMSIGLFTPILLLRTADVGSYNLGVGHMQVYLWMLNAMNDDRKLFVDKYILRKMVNYNFSEKAPDAKIVFRKMGNTNAELIREILVSLVNANKAKVDLRELGQMAGMTLEEIEQTIAPDEPPADPGEGGDGGEQAPPGTDPGPGKEAENRRTGSEVRAVAKEITVRVRGQVESALRDGRFDSGLKINLGFKRKFERALMLEGVTDAISKTNALYGRLDSWLADVVALGADEFSGADAFMDLFNRVLDNQIAEIGA